MQTSGDEAMWQSTYVVTEVTKPTAQTLTVTGYYDGKIHIYLPSESDNPIRIFEKITEAYQWLEDFTLTKKIELDSNYDFRANVT